MQNVNVLQDYWRILELRLDNLLIDGGDILLLATVLGIIVLMALIVKVVTSRFSLVHFPGCLLRRILLPLLVACSLAILNFSYWFKLQKLNSFITLLVVLALASALIQTCNALVSYIFAHKHYARKLNKIISVMLWLCTMVFITDADDHIINFLDSITLHIGKNAQISVWDIVHGVVFIIVAFIVTALINHYLERQISKSRHVDLNTQQILIRLSKVITFILAVLITLPLIGVDITALSVLGGAIGVGIGFGLQKIASNFLSGFIILMDRSIKVGDRLVVDNNSGIISKITMRYVVMARFDGTEVLIPNETLVTSNIQNQSYSSTQLRAEIFFNIGAENDVFHALDIIKQIVQQTPNTIPEMASVHITKLIDSGLEAKANFWVADPSYISDARNYIYVKLLECFTKRLINPWQTSQRVEIVKQNDSPEYK